MVIVPWKSHTIATLLPSEWHATLHAQPVKTMSQSHHVFGQVERYVPLRRIVKSTRGETKPCLWNNPVDVYIVGDWPEAARLVGIHGKSRRTLLSRLSFLCCELDWRFGFGVAGKWHWLSGLVDQRVDWILGLWSKSFTCTHSQILLCLLDLVHVMNVQVCVTFLPWNQSIGSPLCFLLSHRGQSTKSVNQIQFRFRYSIGNIQVLVT